MPYNSTPIKRSAEHTGTVSLPLARVKKIINADEDLGNCSNNAAFVITIATEMFIQYLAEQTHNVVKSEKRNRRNIQYRDIANAVARIDNLEFLADVVPRSTTYRAFKEKKARDDSSMRAGEPLRNGQQTIQQMRDGEQADINMSDVTGNPDSQAAPDQHDSNKTVESADIGVVKQSPFDPIRNDFAGHH